MKKIINNKNKNVLFKVGTQGIAKKRSLAVVLGTVLSKGHRNSSAPRARKSSFFGVLFAVYQHTSSSTSRARALSLMCAELRKTNSLDHEVYSTSRARALGGLCGQLGIQCIADLTSRARELSQQCTGIKHQVHRIGLTPRARLLSRYGVLVDILRLVSSTSRARSLSILGVLAVALPVLGGILIYNGSIAQAAPSDTLNFQGRLLTNTGGLVPDGDYNIEFNLYNVDSGGSTLWTEDRLVTNAEGVSVRNGYFSVYLGELDAFGALDWDQELYLGMTIRGTANCAWGSCTPADSEMTPRFKLSAVPYAFRAANVGSSSTNAVSTNSDGVSISSGDALGATSNSGNITIDSGTATGTTGQILLGTSNASALTLGRSGVTTTLQGSVSLTGAGTALTVTNNAVINGDTTIGDATTDTLTVEADATFNGTLTVSTGDTFINSGATLNTAIAISDVAAGGDIGAAAATVDGATTFNINQTTASQALTLPTPTDTTAGRVVYVNNVGTTTFTMYGTSIGINGSNAFIWNGTQWVTTVSLSGSSVNIVGVIDSVAKSANGGVISGNSIYFQTADATYPGLVSTGAQTFAGAKTFNSQVAISYTGANALSVTGAPANTSTTSLIRIGNSISGGHSGGNGGTYIGINQPGSGAGSTADFVNFQNNGTRRFRVSTGGNVTASAIGDNAETGSYFQFNATNITTLARTSTNTAQIIQGAASQTGDLLQFQNNSAGVLSGVNAAGNLYFRNSTYNSVLSTATLTDNRSIVFPDASGTVVLNSTLATTAFVQNGNSFGATAVLGTNDANSLVLETNDTTALTIDTSQNATFAGTVTIQGASVAVGTASSSNGSLVLRNSTNSYTTTINAPNLTTGDAIISIPDTAGVDDTICLETLNNCSGTDEIITVAASDSSAAHQAAADYVADGTDDQVEINDALTAAAGGKVILLPGTYTTHQTDDGDATIFIPNNTTLEGSGPGTVVQLGDIDATDNMIENSDTSTGEGVVIRDLTLDGQDDLNTTGVQNGIDLDAVGDIATNRVGGHIENVVIYDFRSHAVAISNSDSVLVDNVQASASTRGVSLVLSDNLSVTNSTFLTNSAYGIYTTSVNNSYFSNNTVTDTTTDGIRISSSHNNIITGNTISDTSVGFGIIITGSDNNILSDNIFDDNGGSGENDAIYITDSDTNSIIDNLITDSACTTDCYAIWIDSGTSNNNYLSNNRFYGNATDSATINDAGTGTIYVNQQTNSADDGADVTDFTFRGSANSTTAFAVQNAAGTSILNVDTSTGSLGVTGSLTVSTTSTFTGLATFNGDITVEAGDTFTFNSDAFTDFTGGGLYNNSGLLSVDNITSGSGFFQDGGNSFGATAVLGTNDANNLTLETNNTVALTLNTSQNAIFAGNLGINNASAPNLVSINTLTTADANAQLAISTGAVGNIGLLLQAVAGQTADILSVEASDGSGILVVEDDGSVHLDNVANSNRAFQVRDASGNTLLRVDTDGNRVNIGSNSAGNMEGTTLGLYSSDDSSDPGALTGATNSYEGDIYYNGNLEKFRCNEGGVWRDCVRETELLDAERRQSAADDGGTASATFSKTPEEGNLLIATSFHRSEGTAPSISGSGWTLVRNDCYGVVSGGCGTANTSYRRGMAIWYKIAGASEPANIQTSWSPASDNRLLIQEFKSNGGSFVFDNDAGANSGASTTSSQTSGTTGVTSAYNTLSIAFLGNRDSDSINNWTNNFSDSTSYAATRSLSTAYSNVEGTSAIETTATLNAGSKYTLGAIINFSIYADQLIVQDGNTFGQIMRIGTNDAQSLILETNDTIALTIDSSQNATFAQSLAINGNTTLGDAVGDTLTVNAGSIQFANNFTSCTAINTDASGNLGCDTATYLTSANAFLQGGNDFTANAVLGTNDNYSLILETNDTTALTIDTSQNATFAGDVVVQGYGAYGNIGAIGGSVSGYESVLSVEQSLTSPTDGNVTIGVLGNLEINPGSDPSSLTLVNGVVGEVTLDPTNTTNTTNLSLSGGSFGAVAQGTGTTELISGIRAGASNISVGTNTVIGAGFSAGNFAGTVADLVGSFTVVANTAVGVTTEAVGSSIEISQNSTGALTTARGLEVSITNVSGTLSNSAGVNIYDVDGTNATNLLLGTGTIPSGTYSIYNASTRANYFAGALEVDGLVELNGGLTVEAGDTFSFNSDAFTDLTGNGLQVSGNALTLLVQANKGLEVDVNGISLIDCGNGQVLQYSTGSSSWACADAGADISTDEIITVATSDTPAAQQTAADYLADGTADDVEINAALASLSANGGVVHLLPGTYEITDTITIDDYQTLEGEGDATTLFSVAGAASFNLIENEDQAGGNSNITIRDLQVNGNKDNVSVTRNTIDLENVGSGSGNSAIRGVDIVSVTIVDSETIGISIDTSANGSIQSSSITDAYFGIEVDQSSRIRIENNQISGSAARGISLYESNTNIVVQGNIIESSITDGIHANALQYSTISDNTIRSSGQKGIDFGGGSTTQYNVISGNLITGSTQAGIEFSANYYHNIITGNSVYDNDSSGTGSNIALNGNGDDNQVTNNYIRDVDDGSYAINISSSAADFTYLADNTMTQTAGINDSGTGTIYASQLNADSNDAGADLVLQAPDTISILSNTTMSGTLSVDGNTTLGDAVGDTLTVNAGTVTFANVSDGSGFSFSDASFQNCVLTTNGSGVLTCGAAGGTVNNLQDAYDGGNTILADNAGGDIDITVSEATSFVVTNTGTGSSLRVNDQAGDTTPFIIDADGNVGIGTASPTYKLQVSGGAVEFAGNSSSAAGLLVRPTLTSTVNTQQQGIQNQTDFDISTVSGGTLDRIYGLINLPDVTSAGTVNYTYGLYSRVDNSGSANLTNVYGNYLANGSTTNITNKYGLYVEDQTGGSSSNYGIYVAGGNTYALWVDSDATRLDGTLEVQGASTFQNASNSTSAFRINNAASASLLEADTTNYLLKVAPTQFISSGATQSFGTSGSITGVDSYSTIAVDATAAGLTVTLPVPAAGGQVVGRIIYVTSVNGSEDFTLSLGGTSIDIAMKANSTATLIWNGTGWTAAGASSSTDLQSAYNNTLTSAGGAELVLNAPGGPADGLTVRNNGTTPINGGILEIQSSIGTNLFSVNNIATEYVANGGAENASTFASDWTSVSGTTVTRETTTVATGTGSVQVDTSGVDDGVRNNLATDLATSTQYLVSFTARTDSGTWDAADQEVLYSRDGGTDEEVCTNASTEQFVATGWRKFTCTITTDATSPTNADLIIRQTDATARTIYIDNLSVTENSASSEPDNVQIGGGQNGGPVTLFTLDRASAPPVANGNQTYLGSMYYDTTSGRIQCYEADGWGACGSAPNNYVNLTPEYPGSVLNGTGVGTMTADFCANETGVLQVNTGFCASGESKNYYNWTSPQATEQEYSIYITYQLPAAFKAFEDNDTVQLTARTDNTTNGTVTYEMFRNEGGAITACGTETTVTTSADTWQTVGINGNEADGCGFTSASADNFVIFKINMKASNNANVYSSTLSFTSIGQ